MKQIYYALFLSIATYGIIAWGGASWNNLKPLEIIHKRVIQSMLGLKILFSTSNLFDTSKLLDIRLHFSMIAVSQLIKTNRINYVKQVNNARSVTNLKQIVSAKKTTKCKRAWDVLAYRITNSFDLKLNNLHYNLCCNLFKSKVLKKLIIN